MVKRLPKVATTMHPSSQHLAGFEQRLYAMAIDMLLLYFLAVVVSIQKNGLLMLVVLGVYFSLCWSFGKGQTLGNKIMKIRVVRVDGVLLTWTQAVLRYGGFLLSGFVFFLGFAWILLNKKRQGWHDRLANTMVVTI